MLAGPSHGLSVHPTQQCLLLSTRPCPPTFPKAPCGHQCGLLFRAAFPLLLPPLTAPHSWCPQLYFPEEGPPRSQLCFSTQTCYRSWPPMDYLSAPGGAGRLLSCQPKGCVWEGPLHWTNIDPLLSVFLLRMKQGMKTKSIRSSRSSGEKGQ